MKHCVNKIKRIMMITCISLILLFCSTMFQNKSYAKTMKYTISFDNEQYVILADVSEDGEYVEIIDKFSNITYHHGGSIVEDTFYKTIKTRYEGHFEYYDSTGKFIQDKFASYNAETLLLLLETYLKDTKRIDNNDKVNVIRYIFKKEDDDPIVTVSHFGSEYGISYEKYFKKHRYDDIIKNITTKDAIKDANSNNPYYVKGGIKYSNYIRYDDQSLDDLFTDEEFVLILTRMNVNERTEISQKMNIEIVETSDTKVSNSSISAEIDKTSISTIYLNILENGVKVKRFLIAQDGVEKIYTNSTVNGCVSLVNSRLQYNANKITNYQDTYLMYYTESGETMDTYSDYIVMNDLKLNAISVYKKGNDGGLKKVDYVLKDAQYLKVRMDIKNGWNLVYNNDEELSGIFYIYSPQNSMSPKYIIGINNWAMCYTEGTKYFDLIMPLGIGGTNLSYTAITMNEGGQNVFISSDTTIKKDYSVGNTSYLATGDLLNKLSDYNSNIYLGIYVSNGNGLNMGSTSGEPVDVEKAYALEKADDGTEMKFPIKPFLLIDENMIKNLERYKEMQTAIVTGTYNNNLVSEVNYSVTVEYMKEIISVVKPTLMLVILIFMIFTGITGIIESRKPDARAQMMERYKNIFLGTIFFACATIILSIIVNYVTTSFEMYELPESVDALIAQTKSEINNPEPNMLIGLIDLCLDVATFLMDMVNNICARVLSGTGESLDVIKLIYNVREGGVVSKNIPFDYNGIEWTRYMTGYKALVSVGLLIMLIAIMKMAIEYMIFAGDDKKIAEIKKTFERIVEACLIMVVTPYGVKILIYVFNIFTSLLPVNYASSDFELAFPYTGILRTIINFVFVGLKFKLYFVFLIRKVMIALLLVATPIVAATWAISEKFQSISIWIGELITNIALQFAYACGFMVLIIMSYDGQSNEIGLVLMLISMQLAKFIKDSMQGFFNEWGGIDEEGMADEMTQKVTEIKQKVKGTIQKAGVALASASKYFDKNQNTNIGRITYNVGNVMQGKVMNIQTKADTIQNINRKEKIQNARESYISSQRIYEADKNALSPEKQEELKNMEKTWGTKTKEEKEEIRQKGGAYKSLYNMKDNERMWHSKLLEEAAIRREYESLRKKGIINRMKSYGERASNKELDREYNKRRTIGHIDREELSYKESTEHTAMSINTIKENQEMSEYVPDSTNMPTPIKEQFDAIDKGAKEQEGKMPSEAIMQLANDSKRKVVKDHFDNQFDMLRGFMLDNQTLYEGDFSETTMKLFENYRKQKLSLKDYLDADIKGELGDQEKILKKISKNREERRGKYRLEQADQKVLGLEKTE